MDIKNRINKLNMMAKILVAPVLVIVLLVLFGLASYVGLATQKGALNDIYNNRFKNYQVSADLANTLTDVHMNTYRLLSWETARYDRAKIDKLGKEQLETLKKAVETVKKATESGTSTPEEKKIYEEMSKELDDYQKAIVSAIDLSESDLNFATMFMAKADDEFMGIDKVTHELLELEHRMSQDAYAGAMKTFTRVIVIMAAVLLGAVVLSLVVSVIVARSVTRVLGGEPHEIAAIAKNIANGDLTHTYAAKSAVEGVFGDMLKMVEKLKAVVADVKIVSRQRGIREPAALVGRRAAFAGHDGTGGERGRGLIVRRGDERHDHGRTRTTRCRPRRSRSRAPTTRRRAARPCPRR